ncbi:Cu(I)-responsive transcriptional regulator [Cellvibrio japonicus]|uniref:MerR-family transcriptional regulator n=1 Tax=Cellvibrio japonicus (strain Ueda107) TaxID=498211 RepID=B3PHM4_CELJU|nr:Cu(I)-responsive transcriptional regulator [Cellvibrio japonicus]ACE84786.1 MerR-family transcriptional regulator [Cellvibrio japonicus Ueda107]QEI12496.1 Cu(I)-responsive transcriptional regulator [Cellvibrio japonicus]QEI16070.1 Cu(I)-responsive transcriptional regulator [Cellvibrio japonicus]QEI19648.1 Cu(I)-responsive transcriptional regulator [Cellvibrio japonicus]
MSANRQHTPTLELADAHAQGLYSIGEVARHTGLSAKMIRHYESLGLVNPTGRTQANYRLYRPRDIHLLKFIRSARDLGFSMKQIAILLDLWQDAGRNSAEVKQLALEHIRTMDERINALQHMREALNALANQCHGDHRPDCPILEGIEGLAGLTNCVIIEPCCQH